MLDAPEQEHSPADRPEHRPARLVRRALLLTALGGLLIAGLVTALPIANEVPGLLAGYIDSLPSTGSKGNSTGNRAFNHAESGNCLMWPERTPEAANIVNCTGEHRFEVAGPIDMRTFPGSEYGPDAAPPSATRIEQISQEQCEAAVHRYLGARFDPNSKFIISMLWSGDKAWRQSGERRMLCGLQLPGANNQQIAFKGKVADIDQSKVWPDGTCLGIDPATNQPTDVPVDCAAPHAMEVTGTVNLAEKFPDKLPAEAEQDTFIKDACTRLTDGYLAPVQLRNTTLTLIYGTMSLPSWSAGSREVACRVGATLGNGGWATLLNSAKGRLLINGQPPIPPPDIPQERLNPPAIPMPTNVASAPSPTAQRPSNQHLPQQPAAPATQEPASQPAAPPASPATQEPASQPAAPPANPATPEAPTPEAPPPAPAPPAEPAPAPPSTAEPAAGA